MITLALLVAAAAALVWHSLRFNFVTDDAFISFVYSRNLAEHGQLVFNLGERVEGYTNFLWTVLLAALLRVGLAPEIMSRLLGTAFAIATMLVCAWRTRRDGWSAWDAVPALALAAVPGYACWASGGLETQMFTFFITLGAAWYLGDGEASGASRGSSPAAVPPGMPVVVAPRPRSAIAFGLAALTRPEGLLFFALTGLHRLASARRRALRDWRWVAWFCVLVVPHLLWRRWYYGWWLPNTFYIKSSGGAGTWAQGAYYLQRFVEDFQLWAPAVLALVGLTLARAWRTLSYLVLVVGVFCVYVASVGGDFMGLYRFALPVVPLLFVAAVTGLRQIAAPLPSVAQVAIVAALLGGHAWHARKVTEHALAFIGADRGIDTPGYLRWYTADRAAIGKWFGQHAQPDDYAAVGGAGAQVWYSRIPSLDCFGLSDAHVAHEVPARSNRPGHQKYAPDDYILSRHPTIITSANYMISGAPYVGPDAALWMQRGYHYVSVQVPGLSSPWYSFLLRNDRSLGPLPKLNAPPEREP
jgi:hypothetical protein